MTSYEHAKYRINTAGDIRSAKDKLSIYVHQYSGFVTNFGEGSVEVLLTQSDDKDSRYFVDTVLEGIAKMDFVRNKKDITKI
tara:strand:- start:3278 stop:3523 length:246 start_codon:yes stop_codon:yes gene_type:complete